MRRLVKILSVLVLSMGIMPARVNAGPSGAEAFEKLKTLVGTGDDKTNTAKASLDLELTSGGTAVLKSSTWWRTASRWK